MGIISKHSRTLLVVVCIIATSSACAQVVYDSLSSTTGSGAFIRDIGNTVTLAGDRRFVTSVTINVGIGSSSAGQTNDYVLRFFAPSAPGDYPGKVIWQSPPMTNVVMVGGEQAITFEVPYVRVPETFIFSVMQAGDGYFPLCSGPTIGTSPDYRWSNLRQNTSSYNHLKVRIEAEQRPDARLIASIRHDTWMGIGGDDYYSMEFQMRMGGYWDLFGPSFFNVTEWDKGSFLNLSADDFPEAVDYLTNGIDQTLKVLAEFSVEGNVESDTLVKSAGIADGYPDLYGCVITDFVLKVDNIIIDHSTPGTTYYTSDVTWEIWGVERSPDLNLDGLVNLTDFSIFASAWDTQSGQPGWNTACDISLPCNNQVDANDLLVFSEHWMDGCVGGFEETFETGDFSLYDWQHSGSAPWQVVSGVSYEGSHSARSGPITHNEVSRLDVEINIAEAGTISFYRSVSSESSFDYLRFYIDGAQQSQWSGTVSWSQVSFPVASGVHTFRWSYEKDLSVSTGSDCAWIDLVTIE